MGSVNVCRMGKAVAFHILKGTLHTLVLSFVSLETKSYFLMVVHHSLIFP